MRLDIVLVETCMRMVSAGCLRAQKGKGENKASLRQGANQAPFHISRSDLSMNIHLLAVGLRTPIDQFVPEHSQGSRALIMTNA